MAGAVTSGAQRSGAERAAALLLSLGKDLGGALMARLEPAEIQRLTRAISELRQIETEEVDYLLEDFTTRVEKASSVRGGFDKAEQLLAGQFDAPRVMAIMDELRSPDRSNIWLRLAQIDAQMLATYLTAEYPQTCAVILLKLPPHVSAKVLSLFPNDLAVEVLVRCLRSRSVQKEVMEEIENSLSSAFVATFVQADRSESFKQVAEIFNGFDRQTESRLMAQIEEISRDEAEQIKTLMFAFEDLTRLTTTSMQFLIQRIDKSKLPVALKGTSASLQNFFFDNMSERAGAALREDMELLGPVRLAEVDAAQTLIVATAKELIDLGELDISRGYEEDKLVY